MYRDVEIIFASADDWRRLHVSSICETAGYQVTTCASKHELMHLVARTLRPGRTPDCVLILDAGPSEDMPTSKIVATLRGYGSLIRTVVMADSSDDREVIECLRQGAADFLTYPVSPDDLLQTIYRISVLPNVG